MPTILAQLVLFLSSYAPLFLIMAFLDTWGNRVVSYVCAGVAGLSLLFLFIFHHVVKSLKRRDIVVASARPRDSDAIAYVLTYIVPFVGFVDPSTGLRYALLVLLLLIAVLYIRSYLFYVNPWIKSGKDSTLALSGGVAGGLQ